MKKKKNKKDGYTIIETMIAVSLFLVIIITGMGTFLNANLLHQKSRDMRSIMDSLNFIMNDMSRNLRTGYNYRCYDSSDPYPIIASDIRKSGENCWAIVFKPEDWHQTNNPYKWAYYINNGKIFKSTDDAVNFVQLTPDEVIIDSISGFSVLGAEPFLSNCLSSSNCQQPFIIIKLVGEIILKNTSTPFSLQTSVSQRLIDV